MKTPNIEHFLKHIFQDEYEKGLDYLDLLLFEKWQRLPVIIFPQTNHCSGKTTFIKLLKLIYKHDFTVLKQDQFLSDFNFDWAKKRVIAFDEIDINRPEFLEKIKLFQTSNEIRVEKRESNPEITKFCGCFVISGFITEELEGDRYWRINTKRVSEPDYQLLSKMEKEILQFIRFLRTRPRSTPNQSRFYFE